MNFKEQGEIWISNLRNRRRKPVKQGTLDCYESYLKNWIVPIIGEEEISTFGNGAMKEFVEKLATFSKIGPKSTNEIIQAAKQVIGSAVNSEGDQLYPRKWNSMFIDAPIVEKKKQKTPTIEAYDLEMAIKRAGPIVGPFLAMLGGTGLRIGEALAVRIGDDRCNTGWIPEKRLIIVRTQIQREGEISPKTNAGFREVDMNDRLNQTLIAYARGRRGGFLFENRKGGSIYQSTIREYYLKPLGIHGFHSLRRFRITRLREYGVPEDIIRYWAGHEGAGITDRYSKLAENRELRQGWADRAGLGFDIEIREKSEIPKCQMIDSKLARNIASDVAPCVVAVRP